MGAKKLMKLTETERALIRSVREGERQMEHSGYASVVAVHWAVVAAKGTEAGLRMGGVGGHLGRHDLPPDGDRLVMDGIARILAGEVEVYRKMAGGIGTPIEIKAPPDADGVTLDAMAESAFTRWQGKLQ